MCRAAANHMRSGAEWVGSEWWSILSGKCTRTTPTKRLSANSFVDQYQPISCTLDIYFVSILISFIFNLIYPIHTIVFHSFQQRLFANMYVDNISFKSFSRFMNTGNGSLQGRHSIAICDAFAD